MIIPPESTDSLRFTNLSGFLDIRGFLEGFFFQVSRNLSIF